jgi:hypothetical protein
MDSAKNLAAYEKQQGYVIGPFQSSPFSTYRINPISIAEGKYSKKKRLVVDLSAPHESGDSLNDLIDKEMFSLTYVKLDNAISIIRKFGAGSILNKTDIKDAFKLIPIHPSLWPFHGIQLEENMYFFTRLVFGSRSSPKIFDILASAITWILQNEFPSSRVLHLLDDFLIISPPGSDGESIMKAMIRVFNELRIPLSTRKTVGPSPCLEYLGIQLDTIAMEARLPLDKLERIRHLLLRFLHINKCTKRDLLSLLGHLNYASSVIPPGRTFISRLIQASKSVSKLHYYVYLNSETRKDIYMWQELLSTWNGVSLFIDPSVTPAPDMELQTDASGLGFAGYFHGQWFAAPWPNQVLVDQGDSLSMSFCELYPIVVAAIIWGNEWSARRILFHCDNMGTVFAINKGRSKSTQIMGLLRRLVLVAANYSFAYSARHIEGAKNGIADSLSRFQTARFRHLAPMAQKEPCTIPRDITLA